ncbi:MAG TPA: hypothetical protein VGO34_01615 [Alphaproteobacteria bacterium]
MAASRKASLKRPANVKPDNVAKGGIDARSSQPLRKAPLRETYGAKSGEASRNEGTPETIKGGKDSRRR